MLLPRLDNCKQCCCEHWFASFQISDLVWFFLGVYPGEELLSHIMFLVTVKYTLQQTYSEHVAVEIWFLLIIDFYYHNFFGKGIVYI